MGHSILWGTVYCRVKWGTVYCRAMWGTLHYRAISGTIVTACSADIGWLYTAVVTCIYM